MPDVVDQPPSGGCVLKLWTKSPPVVLMIPAAFGRLCVETIKTFRPLAGMVQPPSGGCVLKPLRRGLGNTAFIQPPSGGCVLKRQVVAVRQAVAASRLRAAVC